MAHHAGRRIVGEYALEPPRRIIAAVADDHHSGVLRIAHPDAAAVMQADPCRAARGVQEGVEQRPIGDRIAAVEHRFRFAIR